MTAMDILAWADLLQDKYGISCPVTFETDEDSFA